MEIQNPDFKNFKSYTVILRSYLMTGQYILYGDLGQRTSKTPAPAIINPFTPANNKTPLNAQTNSCHMILKTKYDAQNTRYDHRSTGTHSLPVVFLDLSKILCNWVFSVRVTLEKFSKSKVDLMA